MERTKKLTTISVVPGPQSDLASRDSKFESELNGVSQPDSELNVTADIENQQAEADETESRASAQLIVKLDAGLSCCCCMPGRFMTVELQPQTWVGSHTSYYKHSVTGKLKDMLESGTIAPDAYRIRRRFLLLDNLHSGLFFGTFCMLPFVILLFMQYSPGTHPAGLVAVLVLIYPGTPIAVTCCFSSWYEAYKDDHFKKIMTEIESELERSFPVKVRCQLSSYLVEPTGSGCCGNNYEDPDYEPTYRDDILIFVESIK